MDKWNHSATSLTHFVIAGIPGLQDTTSRATLFVFFLVMYIITVAENFVFIIVIKSDHALYSPMYLFICNLAFLDVLIPSVTIPQMLHYLITEDGSIAFIPCIAQMALYLAFLLAEGFTLVVMSYDRYQAICNPLHYNSVMTIKHAFMLCALCWTIGSTYAACYVYTVLRIPFCELNRIEYFCCDYMAIALLACADISSQYRLDKIVALIFVGIQVFPVLFSYGKIIVAVLRITSAEGRKKAFSTCASHLLVIGVFYVALAFVLISYSVTGFSEQVRTSAAIVQNVMPSFVNPIIYCAKTKEIRASIIKITKRYKLRSL
ncbi:olfactory receptor 6N2-like [Protopterus annectens]|uniref:olfactory receptor 6N2-like n=1 Tax=Protopterus annectens TaxID=7888 RepID=UPI001CFAB5A1|nr:olfactory receptor 6N2-like [Protopterus annectens]